MASFWTCWQRKQINACQRLKIQEAGQDSWPDVTAASQPRRRSKGETLSVIIKPSLHFTFCSAITSKLQCEKHTNTVPQYWHIVPRTDQLFGVFIHQSVWLQVKQRLASLLIDHCTGSNFRNREPQAKDASHVLNPRPSVRLPSCLIVPRRNTIILIFVRDCSSSTGPHNPVRWSARQFKETNRRSTRFSIHHSLGALCAARLVTMRHACTQARQPSSLAEREALSSDHSPTLLRAKCLKLEVKMPFLIDIF